MSSRATWLIGLIACLAVARPASADTFTFVDTTDVVSITQDGSARTLSPVVGNSLCGVENCFVFVATAATPTLSTVTPAKELEYLEPDGVTFSDEVDYGGPQSRGYLLSFGSDQPENFSPVPPLPPCSSTVTTLCSQLEDGTVQTALIVTWADGSTDTIRLQSDLDPAAVPGPASLVLVGSGITALGGVPWMVSRWRTCRRRYPQARRGGEVEGVRGKGMHLRDNKLGLV